MKKTKCINSEVSYLIAKMGHYDTLTIGDAGLPVPDGVQRIDLAVNLGTPSFETVFETVMSELKVQKAYIASEMQIHNKPLYIKLRNYFEAENIEVILMPHEEFKTMTKESKAVIRTGECKAFANVILESNVAF